MLDRIMENKPTKPKRKYEKRLSRRLAFAPHKKFLIQHLRHQWMEQEKATRRIHRKEMFKRGFLTTGRALLLLLLIAGVVFIGSVAPNVVGVVGRKRKFSFYFPRSQFEKKLRYFSKQKYIECTREKNDNGEHEYEISLTKFGEQTVIQRALGQLCMIEPDHWDGVWRIVIFDIPDTRKWERDALRKHLRIMGFYPLQKSVFLFPHSCRAEINFLVSLLNIARHVHFLETSDITGGSELKKRFSLT